jgi:hypothetical protein
VPAVERGRVTSTRKKSLTAVCLVAATVGVVALAGLAAGANAASVGSELARARAEVGLPPARPNAAVNAAAEALLAGKDAKAAFAALGGVGELVTAVVPAGSALSTTQLERLVFDPRLSALAGHSGAGKVAVAAVLDPALPFARPQLAGKTVDPAVAGSIALLFPPGTATIPQVTLRERRGDGTTVTLGIVATASEGLHGAILVQLKGRDRVTGPQMGYGLRYQLSAGAASFELRTRPLPPVLRGATFAPGDGFRGADRAKFLDDLKTYPPVARTIIDYIGGAVTVRVLANTKPVCGLQTSCAGYDPGNGYFMLLNRAQLRNREFGHFVIAHELGHLVDFLGLDSFSYDRFHGLFRRSPGWKNCFPLNGGCTPFLEVFADQFGAYSLRTSTIPSGYNDPVLIGRGGPFGSLLSSQWAFRPPQDRNPLAGFGPLARSFSDAIASGGSGL